MSCSRSRRGFTIVELMMALAILAIGVSGIVAMQKVMVTSNQHAKDLALATHIAQAWVEQLAVDATKWNHPSQRSTVRDITTDTTWLTKVEDQQNVWLRPAYDAVLQFGPSFDALGNVVSDANVAQARFCTHIRLNWLYPDSSGNGLIRAEVRVFWLRDGAGGGLTSDAICDPKNNAVAIGQAFDRYHFVYQSTAIKQETAL